MSTRAKNEANTPRRCVATQRDSEANSGGKITGLSQSAIRLRLVGVDDWQLWRELRLKALEEAPYAFSSQLADWQGAGDTETRWRGRLSAAPFNLVADLNHAAAGMASATALNQYGQTELISMWVAPFARGHGIGDSLVKAVIEWAQAQHAARVVLCVVETNEQAMALYRRHHFVEVGRIDGAGPNRVAERQMARDLTQECLNL